jgi:hypothetical protein
MSLKKTARLSMALALLLCSAASMAASRETIVFLRHGEKPPGGYGQLNCQGLNRALHLPAVLIAKYGRPYAIYAPDPSTKAHDPAGLFNYVRPLATIEPTAIRLGMPVSTPYGFTDISHMEELLIATDPGASDAVVFVAWEHAKLETMVKDIIATLGGDSSVVPTWRSNDFDSLYVLTLLRDGGSITPSFAVDHENLDGMSKSCPP